MISKRMKIFAVVILTCINLVNYLDRFILSALLPFIKEDLNITDAQLGLLGTVFTFSYSCSAPFLGLLGDRMSRKWLSSITVFFWSVATAVSGLASSYRWLLGVRSTVGIGEAGYGPVAPTLISDYYSEELRSRMLSVYYIGIPLGSALGIMLGGFLGHHYGWRTAFLVAAIPGFVLAFLALFMDEPPRSDVQVITPSPRETFRYLLHTPSYLYNLVGSAAMTFAAGGLAFWFPTFLSRIRGWEITQATQLFGATTVVAGIAGTLFGGFVADLWLNRNPKSYFHVSAIGMLLSVPMAMLAILIESKAWVFPFVFLTEFLLFFNISPLNAAIISVVPARMRATAMAGNILFIHVLGDALSPTAIGHISDMMHSLTFGMLVSCPAIFVGGFVLLLGANKLVEDQKKIVA